MIEHVLEGKHGNALLRLDNEFVQLIANPVTRDGKNRRRSAASDE